MCLVVAALGASQEWPFVLAANRDERHARPAAPAAWWRDRPGIFGGRDLEAGGTWLATDRRGRVAAVTNVREGTPRAALRSRGSLVADFVASDVAAADYASAMTARGAEFGPFNLIVFDGHELHYASNRASALPLRAGIHAYSNSPHGTDWPKVTSARARAAGALGSTDPLDALFELLSERDGVAGAERFQRDHFVVGDDYGTRCSTVLVVDGAGHARFRERSFDARGNLVGEIAEVFVVEPKSTARPAR